MTTTHTAGYFSNPYGDALISDEWAAVLLRDVPVGPLPVGTVLGVYWSQIAAAPVDAGAIAIAYGASTPGDVASLRIVGAVDARAAFEVPAEPGRHVTRDVVLAHEVPAGADLYLVTGVRFHFDAPRVAASFVFDRPSTGVGRVAPAGGQSLLDQVGQVVEFAPREDPRPLRAAVTITMPAGA